MPGVSVRDGTYAGLRLRARLAIRGRVGSAKVGLFELGTHRVMHVPNCRMHRPTSTASQVWCAAPWSISNPLLFGPRAPRLARYLQVVVESRTQSAQVVLVANSAAPDALTECLDLIVERLGPELHSLWFNSNCEHANTILGSRFYHWRGPPP